METIDTIIWDLGNVLQGEGPRDIFKTIGAAQREYDAWQQYKIGAFVEREYYRDILRGSDFEGREDEFATTLRTLQAISAPGPALPLLEPLHKNGYQMAILSNHVTEWARPAIAHLGIEPYFKAIIISSEVQRAKPDLEIYSLALRRMGRMLEPYRCVFIDDKEKNVRAAEHAGLHAIQMTTLEELQRDFDALGVRYA
ncbi:MAG TPA: HAD-IA family hydrolase [Candidatus Binatia bacterium]|nr:HAD-IA family hydrolase [Candidatus Binatia bacterium]